MILSYNEIWRGRAAASSLSSSEYDRVYLFICDWPSDPAARETAATIKSRFGSVQDLPRLYYSAHPEDNAAYCSSIAVEQYREQPNHFIATVHYKTPDAVGSTLNDEAEPDPLKRKPEIVWSDTSISEVVTVDVDGKFIGNSAGDPFDPPLMEERTIPTVVITRNEATFSTSVQKTYANTVNEVAYSGWNPRQAWMRRVGAVSVYEREFVYSRVSYEIWFNERTWDRFVENVGFVGFVYAGPNADPPFTKKELVDAEGKQFTTPRALKGGTVGVDLPTNPPQMSGATIGEYLPNGPVNLRQFQTKKLSNWIALKLPTC